VNDSAVPGKAPPGDGLDELRALLLGDQQRALSHLAHRIDDPSQRAHDVGQVLAQSVAVSAASGPGLSAALVPNVEDAIAESIRRNPQTLADALFPVMGPAIRKSIAAALQSLTQSIEQTIEHSFSPKGLRWRIEALRTGRPFGEIVLRNTLLFRVEQVFLIDRRTGLLMQHAAADHVQVEDTDMVSSMFSAIQDFVRDSFHATDKETLDSLQVGERLVWIEQGPLASLAGVIRGNPPQELRETFRQTIEQIHQLHGGALQSFDGDTTSLMGAHGLLESCLQARFGGKQAQQEATGGDGTAQKKRRSPVVIGLVLVAAALIGLALWSWWQSQRWHGFVERLRAEPGIVLTQSARVDGKYRVAGLRDALAVDPQTVVRNAGLDPNDVQFDWEPYLSLRPQFVQQRAIDRLKPPPGVQLQLDGQTLVAQGSAPIAWMQQAKRDAAALPGIASLDTSKLVLTEDAVWLSLQDRIQATVLGTVEGSPRLEPGQDQTLSQLIGDLRRLGEIAQGRGARAQVDIIGRADGRGAADTGLRLSQARARGVAAALSAQPLPHVDLRTTAVGAAEPLRPEVTPEDRAYNRSVRFRVHPLPSGKAP
jgi:outer membrane protein OmpA-like peptidoglycan-associated protein